MAQYTTLEQVDLGAIAARYGLKDIRLDPLAGGAANSSFRLSSAAGEFVLTVLDNHDADGAARLASHTQALHALGVPTSSVLPAADGELVTDLHGRPVLLKGWIEGEVKQPLPRALLPDAGHVLAQLHAIPPKSPGLTDIPVGTRRLSPAQEALIPQFPDAEFAAWLTAQLGRIHTAEATGRRARKVVHGDLFDDNLIVRPGGGLTVLDWETISLDDPLLDLGMAAVGLAQEHGVLSSERLGALLAGYERIAPLTRDEATALPLEIIHAAVIIAFHRYYRHNVRFPDASRRDYHTRMIEFVESVGGATRSLC